MTSNCGAAKAWHPTATSLDRIRYSFPTETASAKRRYTVRNAHKRNAAARKRYENTILQFPSPQNFFYKGECEEKNGFPGTADRIVCGGPNGVHSPACSFDVCDKCVLGAN